MADPGRREARSAFRTLVRDAVDPKYHTRVNQLLESVVFGAEPILRGLEHFEVRSGSGAPTSGDYTEDGYGIWIDDSADEIYVCLQWLGEFYIIGGTAGGGGGETNTASNLGAGVGVYEQKVGVDLQFNSLVSANAYLTIAEDDPNNEIDFTVNLSVLEGDIDHVNILNIGTNTHADIDTHIADATIHFTEASIDHENILNIGTHSHDEIDLDLAFFYGSFIESFDALVTSDGATITMSLEQSGGGDLTMDFSDGQTTLDCTPAATIALTAGTDAAPTKNYIYILQSTKALTKSTTQWPAVEHIKVGYFLVPSAAYVQSDGCYINQNWNDHRAGTDNQGHMTHMAETIRLTMRGATWHTGVDPNAAGSEYLEITGTSPSVVEFKSTAGISYQMHQHTIPAIDMSGTDDCHVVNWLGDAYHTVTDLADIVDDALGVALQNKWFNLVFWGVCNKTGEYAPLMCNLPTGSYATQTNAERDVDGYDVTTIPHEFSADSCTGFLICRVTCKFTPAGAWSLGATTDLRGVLPGAVAGSAAAGGSITDFSDNLFTIFNVSDVTKIIDFDLSGITTGNTRTITPSDAAMTIPDTVNWTDLTDAGDTILHGHDVTGLTNWPTIDYAYVSGNDAGTDISAAELEELSDGSDTALHIHDGMYYTETELDGGQLDNRYYTETEIDALIAALDYAAISANDGATDIVGSELEELSDGSTTSLHSHTGLTPGAHAASHESGGSDEIDLTDLAGTSTELAAHEALVDEHIDWTAAAAGTIHTDNYIEGGPGTDTDAIHDNVAGEINAVSLLSGPSGYDKILIEDADDSWNKKAIEVGDLGTFSAGSFDESTGISVVTVVDNFGSQAVAVGWIMVENNTGSTLNKGDICYISGDDTGVPEVTLADADAAATAIGELVIISDSTITNGNSGLAKRHGLITGLSGFTANTVQYLSTTAGDATETPPSGTGDIVRVVGYSRLTTTFMFQPGATWVEIA